MTGILSALNGPSGKVSSMRVASLATVLTIVGTWSWVSIVNGQLQQLDPELAAVVVGVLVAKAGQRKVETPSQ